MDALLDRAPCGFVSFGDDSRVTRINTTLLERLGYARGDVLGRHVETLLAPGSRIFYQTHFFPLVKLHGSAREIYLLLRTASGEDVGVLCNADRHVHEGTAATDCVFMEVHERRRYEEALLQARRTAEDANAMLEAQALELELQQEQLQNQANALEQLNTELRVRGDELARQRDAAEEANRAKSSFLAVMSHELRTPLNAISGYVQLLQMNIHGPLTDAQRQALARIDRSQRHLLALINDVLNLSRIESGHVEYVAEPFALATLVASVLPMIEPQIAAKAITCDVDVASDATAVADQEKTQQILLNLLTNAMKFTAPGGEIHVRGGSDPAHAAVYIQVADTGIGIPADMVESVFEPFVQVDTSRTRSSEGAGLGLAISRDLARGMGGDLTAESEVGVGSSFTLTLPMATVPVRPAEAEHRPVTPHHANATPGSH